MYGLGAVWVYHGCMGVKSLMLRGKRLIYLIFVTPMQSVILFIIYDHCTIMSQGGYCKGPSLANLTIFVQKSVLLIKQI